MFDYPERQILRRELLKKWGCYCSAATCVEIAKVPDVRRYRILFAQFRVTGDAIDSNRQIARDYDFEV